MKCNICSTKCKEVFEGEILNRYKVKYFFCPACGHLQTEKPYWLDEAYASSIAAEDTGILKRNYDNRIVTSAVIEGFFNPDTKFLDYGGGWGILTRLMRDDGYDFVWYDKYSKNLFARGFEYTTGAQIELLTAFEVLEHLPEPVKTFEEMFSISQNILFSQPFLPEPIPEIEDWWYYSAQTGQHISFYSKKTFEYLAEKFKKNYVFYSNFHLLSSKTVTMEDFETVIKNAQYIYLTQSTKRQSKIPQDLEYLKNKAAAQPR